MPKGPNAVGSAGRIQTGTGFQVGEEVEGDQPAVNIKSPSQTAAGGRRPPTGRRVVALPPAPTAFDLDSEPCACGERPLAPTQRL
jgi:hypothetical protein